MLFRLGPFSFPILKPVILPSLPPSQTFSLLELRSSQPLELKSEETLPAYSCQGADDVFTWCSVLSGKEENYILGGRTGRAKIPVGRWDTCAKDVKRSKESSGMGVMLGVRWEQFMKERFSWDFKYR